MELVTKFETFNVVARGQNGVERTYDVRVERVWSKEYSNGVQRWDLIVNGKRVNSTFARRKWRKNEIINMIEKYGW